MCFALHSTQVVLLKIPRLFTGKEDTWYNLYQAKISINHARVFLAPYLKFWETRDEFTNILEKKRKWRIEIIFIAKKEIYWTFQKGRNGCNFSGTFTNIFSNVLYIFYLKKKL